MSWALRSRCGYSSTHLVPSLTDACSTLCLVPPPMIWKEHYLSYALPKRTGCSAICHTPSPAALDTALFPAFPSRRLKQYLPSPADGCSNICLVAPPTDLAATDDPGTDPTGTVLLVSSVQDERTSGEPHHDWPLY